MNFTPSNDYAELRTQARALATLADSLQKQLDHVSNDAADLRRKLALTGDDAVRAERATNEQLTAALEAAEAREAELRARVAELEGMVPKWVPVSERLPEVLRDDDGSVNCVLVYAKDGYECGSDIQVANTVWANGPTCQATHWMPLPAAPKEEV